MTVQQGGDGRDELAPVDRAAAQLQVDVDVVGEQTVRTCAHCQKLESTTGKGLGKVIEEDRQQITTDLTSLVATLQGGVLFNIGSAVILPEAFLKALALARNLGHKVEKLTTVNLDFIRQYRPAVNVVERPTRLGGRGIYLVGQHEIMWGERRTAQVSRWAPQVTEIVAERAFL